MALLLSDAENRYPLSVTQTPAKTHRSGFSTPLTVRQFLKIEKPSKEQVDFILEHIRWWNACEARTWLDEDAKQVFNELHGLAIKKIREGKL